jgi:hypothetical protein
LGERHGEGCGVKAGGLSRPQETCPQ